MSISPAPRRCRCISSNWKNHGNNVEVSKRLPTPEDTSQNASSVIYDFRVEAKAAGITRFNLLVHLNVSPVPDGVRAHAQRSWYLLRSRSGESEFTCDDVTKICKHVKEVANKVAPCMNIHDILSDRGKREFRKHLSREVVVSKLVGSGVAALINSVTSEPEVYDHEKACSGSTSQWSVIKRK